ncbi:hypothetical protein SAMD00019534_039880 [Acytostelium subglobosum LB1]|uniref:hypothetical protein n=1 Tax=Acytostelium subglobosum LB1 TaxID=1410327 RepID=UPI000644EB2D|nr:hypothetical protein SAMD00019534_039880 [Acytostelium subglobosum LB1]GAM20813.1 hypothetical protein SAMD00019534_039880 [Acytostelium subglobosum LB1]|eukprot:XP_012755947.1 hypothetical protein SAMD00019534_039880 [Acytostelium subglobosum LB1]
MAELIRCHPYSGLFEIHITVKNDEHAPSLDTFRQVCSTTGCKPVLIELPKGQHPTQMMTSSYHRGTLIEIQSLAYELANKFICNNFTITRIKIEIMFSCVGVPLTDLDAQQVSPENYFEFHIKLNLPANQDYVLLHQLIDKHQAHLSKNAFKANNDTGEQQRFVTMRMYHIGKDKAEARYLACLQDLEDNNFKVDSKMREYSIYDSNVHLDAGWIEKSTSQHQQPRG